MNDRDRLIEFIDDFIYNIDVTKWYSEEHDEGLADYLLANGVIVPPCKVGDKVWFVVEYDGKHFLDEGEVGSIYKDNGGVWVSARYDSGLHYHHKESDVGKSIFLTKEEAEAKLRGLSNGTT